jgi:hypothetical protein
MTTNMENGTLDRTAKMKLDLGRALHVAKATYESRKKQTAACIDRRPF